MGLHTIRHMSTINSSSSFQFMALIEDLNEPRTDLIWWPSTLMAILRWNPISVFHVCLLPECWFLWLMPLIMKLQTRPEIKRNRRRVCRLTRRGEIGPLFELVGLVQSAPGERPRPEMAPPVQSTTDFNPLSHRFNSVVIRCGPRIIGHIKYKHTITSNIILYIFI